MHHLWALGMRVPQDVRPRRLDDSKWHATCRCRSPRCTQPAEEIGSVAVRMMLERMASPGMAPRHVMLNCEVVVRESSVPGAAGLPGVPTEPSRVLAPMP